MKKNKGGGGGGPPSTEPSPQPSTNSSNGGGNPRNYDENEELERATVQKYRRRRINERGDGWCMVIYRLNAWREKNKGAKECQEGNPSDDVLPYYKGRIDFDVNADDKDYYSYYVFSKSDRPTPRKSFHERNPEPRRRGSFNPHPRKITCYHEKVSFTHCYVYPLKRGKEYTSIEDNSETGTFVNGERIPKGKECPLADGDIISLGSPHHSDEHWGDEKKKRGFVFKVKCFKRRDEQDNEFNRESDDISSPVFLALNNNLVLGEILNFLSHDDLKTARLINTFWKGMADPKLWSRVLLEISDRLTWETSFAYTLKMTKKYNFPNWRIHFDNKEHLDCRVMELIKTDGHLAKNLHLDMVYISENFGDQFLSLLRYFPNLESIQLFRMMYACDLKKNGSIIKAEATFPSVKHIRLDAYLSGDLMQDTILQFYKLFPNIEKITTDTDMEQIPQQISMQNLWTVGLKEIVLGNIYRGLRGVDVCDILRGLPHKLRKLELHTIPPFENPSELASFQNMLETHARTLEHLLLRFKMRWRDSGRGYRRSKKEIKLTLTLPSCPKLKSLEFLAGDQKANVLDFDIIFASSGSVSISYEQDFPVIKELRLLPPLFSYTGSPHPANMGDYRDFLYQFNMEGILDVFIPKDSETVSRTMAWIEFRLEGHLRKKGNPWYQEFVDRFRRMFPHVHHPNLNEMTVKEMVNPRNDWEDAHEDEEPPPARV